MMERKAKGTEGDAKEGEGAFVEAKHSLAEVKADTEVRRRLAQSLHNAHWNLN